MSKPDPSDFHVHLYPVIRLQISQVSANTRQEAIEVAKGRFPAEKLDSALAGLEAEWAEEFSHYLVDVDGDEEFVKSQFFYSSDDPCLTPLRSLLAWADGDQDEHTLQQIVQEVRNLLDLCV